MPFLRRRPALVAAAFLLLAAAAAGAAERSEIPDQYKWNLADLYADEAAWTAAKETLAKKIPELSRYQGTLGQSAGRLHEALTAMMDASLQSNRLSAYAYQLADQDRRVSRSLELQQVADQLSVQFSSAVSFFNPEILSLGPERVNGFLAAEPKLAEYKQFLHDILRRAPHTLTPSEEKIVAQAGNFSDAGQAVHSIFTNADLPYPEVTLSTGDQVRLDAAAYTRYRALPDRAERDRVFKAFWTTYAQFERTLGVALNAHVKTHVFDKEVHKFDSSLEAALFDFNIPTRVYEQLIADVHANLPTLHRYLKLRQRMMGIDQLRYEDLYAPILERVDLEFSPEKAMELTLAAVAPLGKEYAAALEKGFASRWIDFMPSTGKRSGAYSNAVYGVHPYQLQNYMGRYEDVSTLAHEAGHSMHSLLSMKAQPYVTADYPIFVAEVASTLNENMLLDHMLKSTQDDATRLFLLGSYLDNMRQTLFRQTLFAEFELRIHQQADRGEPLTGENMSALYGNLLREYYGDAPGVCKVDSLYSIEWAYIPHFYYNFYVYQYATSMIASMSLADGIRTKGTPARDAYLKLLSSGSSKYAIDLLKEAGVDMTTSEPFNAAIKEMNRIMAEMESILSKGGGRPKS